MNKKLLMILRRVCRFIFVSGIWIVSIAFIPYSDPEMRELTQILGMMLPIVWCVFGLMHHMSADTDRTTWEYWFGRNESCLDKVASCPPGTAGELGPIGQLGPKVYQNYISKGITTMKSITMNGVTVVGYHKRTELLEVLVNDHAIAKRLALAGFKTGRYISEFGVELYTVYLHVRKQRHINAIMTEGTPLISALRAVPKKWSNGSGKGIHLNLTELEFLPYMTGIFIEED